MWGLGRECRCLFGLCAVRLAGAVGERSRALWRGGARGTGGCGRLSALYGRLTFFRSSA